MLRRRFRHFYCTVVALPLALISPRCFGVPQASVAGMLDVPADLRPAGSGLEPLAAEVHLNLESGHVDKAVCQDFLSKLARSGDGLLASRWLHAMRKHGVDLDAEIYEVIVEAHCDQKLALQGEVILEVHAKELASDQGRLPSPASYGHLAEAFADRGDLEKAQAYLTKMKTSNALEMRPCDAVIRALAKRGQSDAARRWLDAAITQGLQPSRACFTTAISAFAKDSRLSDAEGLLKAMHGANVNADAETWGWLLVASIAPNSRVKKKQSYTSPEAIFQKVLDAGIVPDSFILRALGKAIGLDRRDELCKELGVDLSLVPGRARKNSKSKNLRDAPRLIPEEDILVMNEDRRYWPGSGLFRPNKDFGPKRPTQEAG